MLRVCRIFQGFLFSSIRRVLAERYAELRIGVRPTIWPILLVVGYVAYVSNILDTELDDVFHCVVDILTPLLSFPLLLLLLLLLFLGYPRTESFLLSLLCLLVRIPVARLVGIHMGDCLFAIDILTQLIVGL